MPLTLTFFTIEDLCEAFQCILAGLLTYGLFTSLTPSR